MPLLTEAEVVAEASRATQATRKTAHKILVEAKDEDEQFDVFLSHSSNEPERIILGVKKFLEMEGLSVYVDKYTDPQISPENVTLATAELLRHRLNNSNSLIYIYSGHSKLSRWMPWELGFMDGLSRKIGIAPVVKENREAFEGEQFLGLYPYVDRQKILGKDQKTLWIRKSVTEYARLSRWIKGASQITART